MLYTPNNFMTLSDFMMRNCGEKDPMTLLANEYETPLTIGADLPVDQATGRDEDYGTFEEPWEYNKTSNTTSLDEGAKFYKTGMYDRRDIMGMRSSAIGIEEDKYKYMGSKAKLWRAQQTYTRVRHIALDQEHDIFHGDPLVDEKSFLGLYPRYGLLTNEDGKILAGDHAGELSPYVTIDAKGTHSGSLCSAFILVPGNDAVCKIYPNDTDFTAGLMYDKGEFERVYTQSGASGETTVRKIASDIFKSTMGLAIRNRHACVRIANIDLVGADASSGLTNLQNFEFALMQAFNVIPAELRNRARIYVPEKAIPYFKLKYNGRVVPNTYEGAKPKNIVGDFTLDNGYYFRGVTHMTMGEEMLARE